MDLTDTLSPDYGELLRSRIEARDGTPLPNGTPVYEMMLMLVMFKNAGSIIRILTGKLNARVYGSEEVISAAKQFLANPDHRLEIIFEEEIGDEDLARHPLLAALEERSNLELWRVRPEWQGKLLSHFALMDGDSYRFEADKTKPSGVAVFGDKEHFRLLANAFEAIKKMMCDKVHLLVPA
jgi:hypothetical protein